MPTLSALSVRTPHLAFDHAAVDAISQQPIATVAVRFETDWSPDDYLHDYYREVQPDERATMRFLVDAAEFVGDVPSLLEVGCGPTVHHLLPFAARTGELHVSDYLDRNLAHVRRWVAGADDAWDWTPFTRFTLQHEYRRPPTDCEVAEREACTRERIASFQPLDLRRRQPLTSARRYPAVLCCFCPDSITADLDEWHRYTANAASLVAPGGWFVITALGGAGGYRVGERRFPSAAVTREALAETLAGAGFSRLGTTIVSVDVADDDGHGFDQVLLAVSRKP